MLNPILYRPLTEEEIAIRAYRPPPAEDGGPHFMFDGHVVTFSEFKFFLSYIPEPVLVAGSVTEEPNLVHLFDSREAFEAWGRRTSLAYCFDRMHSTIYRFRHPEPGDLNQQPGVGFISNLGRGRDLSEMPVIWPLSDKPELTLYEGKNFTGRELKLGISAIANLKDFQFSARASSVRVRGVLMLSDQENFGGYRFYIAGEPSINVVDMARWGFDKAARSAILI